MHAHSPAASWSAWLPSLLLLLPFVFYLWAAHGPERRPLRPWNPWRTLCFAAGLLLLALAFLPPVVAYAHHDLRGHMVQHLLVGMLAPLGMVLGAPLTLAFRSLPVGSARQLTWLLRSRFFRVLGHPVTALVLNIGGMYVLYLTPLYSISQTNDLVHLAIHLHFLAAGYLFTWSLIGREPGPHRASFTLRLGVLFVSIAAHACLSKLLYAYEWPRLSEPDPQQVQQAAQLMYYGGDLAEVLLAIAFFGTYQAGARSRQPKLSSL